MEWLQIFTIMGSHFFMLLSVFGIIWCFRKESREDWIRCQNTIDAIRSDINNFNEKLLKIDKDFHERLLKIEMERNK